MKYGQEFMRLDRTLTGLGFGTRSEIREILRANRVTVNGLAIRVGAFRTKPAFDRILLDGNPVMYMPYPIVMMNKPTGVITANGNRYHTTVVDLLPERWRARRLMPVGRLDLDTTGLLLFTNDGELSHRLCQPKRLVNKLYRAVLDSPVCDDDITAFAQGIQSKDISALPAVLERDPANDSVALVSIHEGQFHQVKLMFAACGKRVLELARLSVGPIQLDPALRPGACRVLSENEEAALRAACGAAVDD